MRNKIIDIIREVSETDKEIKEETELHELCFDSLLFVILIVRFEEEFDIETEYEELDYYNYKNVEEVINFVEVKTNEGK